MRALVQRVNEASVEVDGRIVGKIGKGLLCFVGFSPVETEKDLDYCVDKILNLRILEDDEGKMNRSVLDSKQEILVVSQFTLYADARAGRRPSWSGAASAVQAQLDYQKFLAKLQRFDVAIQTGIFQADMKISVQHRGPVSILLDSQKLF